MQVWFILPQRAESRFLPASFMKISSENQRVLQDRKKKRKSTPWLPGRQDYKLRRYRLSNATKNLVNFQRFDERRKIEEIFYRRVQNANKSVVKFVADTAEHTKEDTANGLLSKI